MTETKSHRSITKRILTLLALSTAALGLGFQNAQAETGEFTFAESVGWVYDCGDCWAYCYALNQYIYIPGLGLSAESTQRQGAPACRWVFLTEFEKAVTSEQSYYQSSDCLSYFTWIKELDKWVCVPGLDMIEGYGWIYVME